MTAGLMALCSHESQVRMAIDKFGTAAVRNAWYNPKQVSEHVLSGYTRVISVWFSILLFCTIFFFCHTQIVNAHLDVITKNAAIEE